MRRPMLWNICRPCLAPADEPDHAQVKEPAQTVRDVYPGRMTGSGRSLQNAVWPDLKGSVAFKQP